jgi:UDP-N-acetylglucosamine--N-acetylmuramyl-(pentapeptide) pyrophosphoryl-undecaprenol N-acetylglucosamine transferase
LGGARILITGGGTGGHLDPALNIAAEIRRLDPAAQLFYVGSRRGLEARVLPTTDMPHRLLPIEPLRRSRPWRNWRLAWSAPAVLAGVDAAFRSFRPEAVLGTGVSAPALLRAWLGRVPIALQEQNARPGLVTRLMAPRAADIYLAYPEAEAGLRPGARTRTRVFGNPVARRDAPSERTDPGWPAGRLLLVFGGSQGARAINERLLADLEAASPDAWPADTSIVWIAGADHAEAVAARVASLPRAERILVVPYVPGLGRYLDRIDLAVARAGAMSVAELCAAGCPSVLIPLPTAAADHQTLNARALAEAGAAIARAEAELAPGELWGLCRSLLEDRERLAAMASAARARGHPDATTEIASAVLELARGAS